MRYRRGRPPTTASSPVPGPPASGVGRPPSAGFLALAGLVIAASVAVRLVLLGRQSYWIDELFSVDEASGSLPRLLRIGSTEVHTPLFAGLLWGWIHLGGTGAAWTRLLSTLLAVIAVLVTDRGLRRVPIDAHVRWALTVATAAGGTSLVYALDTRSYALLLLGSVGLTIGTLRAALLTLAGDDVPRRLYLTWTGWVALAATAHLFGAVLALGSVVLLSVLTVSRVRGPVEAGRRMLTWVLLAAVGCALQAVWILAGLRRPEFAEGTDWIQAPNRHDLRDLVTTTFASGALTTHKDGYAWTSPLGVIVVLILGLGAALYGFRARGWRFVRRPEPALERGENRENDDCENDDRTAEGPAAAILLALAAIITLAVFAVSQWAHLWTLRNMVIVAPALIWGAIGLAAAASGTAAGRRAVAIVVVGLLGLSLVPAAVGLSRPYKTDFRSLIEYLTSVQAAEPQAQFVFLGRVPPERWSQAVDDEAETAAWAALLEAATWYPRGSSYPGKPPKVVARPAGPEIVTYYRGVANPRLDRRAVELLKRLGPTTCRRIPIYSVIVVRCH